MSKRLFIPWGIFILLIASAIVSAGLLPASSAEISPESGSPEPKFIALTFDDGPDPVYTPVLLDGLAQRGVKASFFLIGKNIDGNEDIIRRMDRDGHLIGNHTTAHVMLTALSEDAARQEIEETNQKISQITGKPVTYLRPPFGSWNEEMEDISSMEVILWNIDPLDWKVQNRKDIVSHVLQHAKNGGIILLHDHYPASVEAALEIVDTLQAEGYTFVTAEELLIN